MSWTEKVSTRIAKKIRVEESPYTVGQISHGIEIVMLYLLNATALLLSSIWLDVFYPAIMIAILYILHRSFTSGIHMKSPWTCLVGGVLSILICSLIVKNLPVLGVSAYFLVVSIFTISFLINYRYAPAEHTYVSTSETIKRISRKIIATLLVIGCLFCLFLIYFGYRQLAITYALAVFLQSLHLHPISFWVVARFENLWKEG